MAHNTDQLPDLLKVAQAASICNIGLSAAYEMCHAASPEGWKSFTLRVGAGTRGLRVKKADLLRWIDRRCGLLDPQDHATQNRYGEQDLLALRSRDNALRRRQERTG